MDNSEISGTAKMATSLVVVAAVIGLTLGIFKLAKSTANDGVAQYNNSISTVAESKFTEYDNSVLNGSQIISAWSRFDGENVALLLSTKMAKDTEDMNNPDSFQGPGTKSYKSNNEGPLPFVIKAYEKDDDRGGPGEPYTTLFSDKKDAELCFINYNAVLLGSVQSLEVMDLVDDAYIQYMGKPEASVYWDKDSWVCDFGFADKNGKVLMNKDSDNIKVTSTLEYIKPNAKFQCNLVKASTGETLGVAFEEVG